MKNLEKNFKSLTRGEMKNVKGGDACTTLAQQCISHLPCVAASYGAFATCIGGTIIGCSPLREFEIMCPNAGM